MKQKYQRIAIESSSMDDFRHECRTLGKGISAVATAAIRTATAKLKTRKSRK